MSSVSIYHRVNGLKEDKAIHAPVIASKQFHKTPAYKFAVKRAMALGNLDKKQAHTVLLQAPAEGETSVGEDPLG